VIKLCQKHSVAYNPLALAPSSNAAQAMNVEIVDAKEAKYDG